MGRRRIQDPVSVVKSNRFSQCPYLIPSLRPTNWNEDPDIRRKIDTTYIDRSKDAICNEALIIDRRDVQEDSFRIV